MVKPVLTFLAATRGVQDIIDNNMKDIMNKTIEIFNNEFYDMYVIEPNDGKTDIRRAGYSFIDNTLDEKTIVEKLDKTVPKKVWFKVDKHSELQYVGTFLLPSEYYF